MRLFASAVSSGAPPFGGTHLRTPQTLAHSTPPALRSSHSSLNPPARCDFSLAPSGSLKVFFSMLGYYGARSVFCSLFLFGVGPMRLRLARWLVGVRGRLPLGRPARFLARACAPAPPKLLFAWVH